MILDSKRSLSNNLSIQNKWQSLLCLTLAGFLIYFNSFTSPFMLDDNAFFDHRKENIKNIGLQFIPDLDKKLNINGAPSHIYYRPLQNASLMILFSFYKKTSWLYHITNLILFILSAWLFYLFFRRIFKDSVSSFWTALLYIVHPINGVIVNYNTASVFPLQTIFMILSLWAGWKAVDENKGAFHALSILGFIASFLFHETALAVPIYFFALLFFTKKMRIPQALKSTTPLIITGIIYFLFRLKFCSLRNTVLGEESFQIPILNYLASLTKLITWYLTQLVCPKGITLMWVTTVIKEGLLFWNCLFAVLLVVVCFLFWRGKKEQSFSLGLSWLLIGFLPLAAASMSYSSGMMIEPHWFVFSSIGFFMMLGSMISLSFHFTPIKIFTQSLVILIILFWSGLSMGYNYLWANEIRYCHYWLKETPNFRTPQFFLARAYLTQGHLQEAKKYYKMSLTGNYSDWLNYTNIGTIEFMQHNFNEAERNLKKALNLEPKYTVALNTLGVLYAQQGELDKAKEYFQRSINADYFGLAPRTNLAKILIKEKNYPEAKKLLNEALNINPRDVNSLKMLKSINF